MGVETLFTNLTLTALEQASAAIRVGAGPMGLLLDYTSGASRTLNIRMEISDEDSDTPSVWYRPTDGTGVEFDPLFAIAVNLQAVIPLETAVSVGATAMRLGPLLPSERRVRFLVDEPGTGGFGSINSLKFTFTSPPATSVL